MYKILFITLVLSLLNSQILLAQSSVGAISSGMAGGGRSSVDVGESYLLNPASVAHLQGAAITFGTNTSKSIPQEEILSATITERQKGTNYGWHLTLNENGMDSPIASSIILSQSKFYTEANPSQASFQWDDAWLVLGNFVYQQMSVGMAYHYHGTLTPLEKYQEHRVNLGFLWTPFERLGVGLSLQNLGAPSPKVPESMSLGSSAGLGLLYFHDSFLKLRLDMVRKLHPLQALSYSEGSFGMENAMTPWLLFRVGFGQQRADDGTNTQKWTMGLGFDGPRFGIHYGFQQYRLAQNGTEHSVDFTLPF